MVFEWSSNYIQWLLELLIAISLWSSFKNNIYKKWNKKKINSVLRTAVYKFTEYLSTLYASWSFVHVKDMCTSHGGTIIIGHHIHNTVSNVIYFKWSLQNKHYYIHYTTTESHYLLLKTKMRPDCYDYASTMN